MSGSENASELRLFDSGHRTDLSGGRQAETAFQFCNRSGWKSAQKARDILEEWFAQFPLQKRRDLQSRFRGDDRSHAATLLEIVTHEILRALCSCVQVEPEVSGKTPDFAATYDGVTFIVECTVTQPSDREFGALQREKAILDAVNSVDTGLFQLIVEPRTIGAGQPSALRLRKKLRDWIESITPRTIPCSGAMDTKLEWKEDDWEIHFEAIRMPGPSESAIGATVLPVKDIVDDSMITRALEKKAEDYRQPEKPYLVVLAQRDAVASPTVILDALFGPKRWLFTDSGVTTEPRRLDGFWGSRSKPRKQHVSAVLYKRTMKDVWSICTERTASDPNTLQVYSVPEWYVVHNPFTEKPLPRGIFPFAKEYAPRMERMVEIEPTSNINETLGLPDPWPGEEH